MTSRIIASGNLTDTYCLIPLCIQHLNIACTPGQITECISVGCCISCRGTKECLDLTSEPNLCLRICPPFHEFPGCLLNGFILRFDHHGSASRYKVGSVNICISVFIHILRTRDQCEIPESADFRCRYHQCIISGISCHTDRHLS